VSSVVASLSAVVQKDIRVAIKGYLRALDRLEVAVAKGPDEPDDVYISIAEATNWLVSIAERTSLSGNVDVQAVVFARHRTHHHLASVSYYDEARAAHLWRPVTQLPEPEDAQYMDDKRKPFYAERLAGEPVLDVFARIGRDFR
jgi:hypothetical protein